MLGHDATKGGAMRDRYDNPLLDDIFAEQEDRLPDGTPGTLCVVVVRHQTDLGEYTKVVGDYDKGHISTMEMASRMGSIRLQRLKTFAPLEVLSQG